MAPGADHAWADAARIAAVTGDLGPLTEGLWGLVNGGTSRGQLETALDASRRLATLGTATGDVQCIIGAAATTGLLRMLRGELEMATDQLCEARRVRDEQPADPTWVGMLATLSPSAACLHFLGVTSWLAGEPEAAATLVADGVIVARRHGNPIAICIALFYRWRYRGRRSVSWAVTCT